MQLGKRHLADFSFSTNTFYAHKLSVGLMKTYKFSTKKVSIFKLYTHYNNIYIKKSMKYTKKNILKNVPKENISAKHINILKAYNYGTLHFIPNNLIRLYKTLVVSKSKINNSYKMCTLQYSVFSCSYIYTYHM